jgi:hypothetical protein
MTVMIDRFFGVHPDVLRAGHWRKMKPGEKDLLIYLMHESERYRSRVLRRRDSEITGLVGVSSRTLCNARKKLQERGLISYSRRQGDEHSYTVCDPSTGSPYPGDARTPVKYKRIQDSLSGSSPTTSTSGPPTNVETSSPPPVFHDVKLEWEAERRAKLAGLNAGSATRAAKIAKPGVKTSSDSMDYDSGRNS